MMRGKFISLEGIEGCGKTTQQRLLTDWLETREIPHLTTKQPGGSVIGAEIRKILLNPHHTDMVPACEAMLYLADRAQHVGTIIQPALKSGTWVICDRYHDSTLAYQGAARGLSRHDLNHMFQLATGGLQPDLTLLLDLDPVVGLTRARTRNHDQGLAATEGRFEDEKLTFHRSCRAAFLELAQREPNRFLTVNSDREPQTIARDIQNHIDSLGWLAHV